MDVLNLTTEHVDGASVVIRLDGELDAATVPAFSDLVSDLISRGHNRLVLHLGSLCFIDSTGLGAFIGARNRARGANGSLVLRDVSERVASILTLVGLDEVLEVQVLGIADVELASLASR